MKRITTVLWLLLAGAAPAMAQSNDASLMGVDARPADEVRVAIAEGRASEAVLLADRALLSAPVSARGELHFWRAAALLRADRAEEALVALAAAEQAGFGPAELHVEKALALSANGRERDALEAMDRARALL